MFFNTWVMKKNIYWHPYLFSVAVKSLVCDRVVEDERKKCRNSTIIGGHRRRRRHIGTFLCKGKPISFGKNSLAVNQKEKDKFRRTGERTVREPTMVGRSLFRRALRPSLCTVQSVSPCFASSAFDSSS